MARLTRDEILSADRVLKLLSVAERGTTAAESAAFAAKAKTLADRNGYAARLQEYRDQEGRTQ